MSENIYYVGAQPSSTSNRSSNTQIRHQPLPRPIITDQNNNHKANNSRSTSCPKTERSRYAITLQQLRNRSPKVELNTHHFYDAKQEPKAELKILTARNASASGLSSAFNRISVRPVAKQTRKPNNLFKKVQQPRFRPKGTFRITKQIDCRAYTKENRQSNEHKIGSAPNYQSNNSEHNKPQSKSELSQTLEMHYRMQPLKKLFLCTRCYQFTPVIELRAHHLSCHIPLHKQQFCSKWLKIINLLKQILRQHNTNQLYRLIDRMEWYISECHIGHRQGYILYSQQLACVLSLKASIKLKCVQVDDLFWLIETVGDLLQTKSIDLQQTAFWKICT